MVKLQVTVSEEEAKIIISVAEQEHRTVSGYIRGVILDKIIEGREDAR